MPSRKGLFIGGSVEVCLAVLSVFVAPSPLSIFLAFPSALLADFLSPPKPVGLILFWFVGFPMALLMWTFIFAWIADALRKPAKTQ
jgi:hypothetical protein